MAKNRRRRERAWLEKKRGAFGIRYRDPVKTKEDGSPVYSFAMIDAGNGERVYTESAALPHLDAFLAKLPAAERRSQGTIGRQRLTLGQVALKWHAAMPEDMESRDKYMSTIQGLMGPDGLGVLYCDEITRERVRTYKARKDNVGTEVPLAYLRSVLVWAASEELIDAVPTEVLGDMTRKPSDEAPVRMITPEEFALTFEVFKRKGPHYHALAHCLSLYGWRPKTACRLLVGDVDLRREEITLKVKRVRGKKTPHTHVLLPCSMALLRPIVEGRHATEPLFLHESGKGWKYGESADQLCNFYYANCTRFAPGTGGIYAWKRWAIEGMAIGRAPWPKPITDLFQMMGFTGHADPEMLLRYRRHNTAAQRMALGLPQVADLDDVYVIQMPLQPTGQLGGGEMVVNAVVDGGGSAGRGLPEVVEGGAIVTQFVAKLGRI